MTYDRFVEACDLGRACPACFTTFGPFIKKHPQPVRPPFECLCCGHRFSGHEFVNQPQAVAACP
jgi:hypothetical protein